MVEIALLFFRSSTNLRLYLCIADDYEMPGLLIGALGALRATRQAIFDRLPHNRT